MNKDLRRLLENFTSGTPKELQDATVFLAMMLEYYSINPDLRFSRRSDMATFVPERLLGLEVTDDDLREVVRVVVEYGPGRLDLGVCFWILGKPSQALGAAAAVRLLKTKGHLLSEDQAVQAATTLRNLLIQHDLELEALLGSEWFRFVLRKWISSESVDLKNSARSLERRLSATWGIRFDI